LVDLFIKDGIRDVINLLLAFPEGSLSLKKKEKYVIAFPRDGDCSKVKEDTMAPVSRMTIKTSKATTQDRQYQSGFQATGIIGTLAPN